MRFLFALLVALCAVSARADVCTQYQPSFGTNYGGWHSSKQEACNASVSLVSQTQPTCTTNGQPCTWAAEYNQTTTACSVIRNGNTAYAIQFSTRTGDYCQPECPAGVVETKNLTIGYAGRDYDANSEVPNGGLDYLPNGSRNTAGTYPSMPSSVCIGSCSWSVGAATGDFWASRQPTSAGMYRMSADYELTSLGATCTASTEDKDFTDGTKAAPSSCPGSQGYINGRPACIPKDAVQSPKALPQDKPHKEGNPKAGSSAGAADRIPTTNGDGGNKGGPPHPRDGVVVTPSGTTLSPTDTGTPSGTKTSVTGEEQLNCGAPGQPRCRIDETGTPTTRTFALDEAAINAVASSNRTTISGNSDKGMFSSWNSVFVTPPVVACEATTFNMATGQTVSADPCPVVEGTRSVVGWLWALSGFWLCLGWIRESV